MVSIAEVYAHLSIECPSGFLQAEVVVQLLVRKVPALEREVVASATETVGKAQVVGELINKYTPLKSWAELDNLKWDNAPKGNVYTISWLPDYDSEQHPANVGCVEVVRMGGGVTAQILYADNFKMYIRTFLGKEDARWTAWTQV